MVVRSNHYKAAFVAAQDLQRSGRLAEAERAWRELDQKLPGHVGVITNLAMVLWQLSKFEAAEISAEQALKIAPDTVQARAIFAASAESQGKIDQAIERYIYALEIAPRMSTVLHCLSNLYRQRGDLKASAHYARRMAHEAPDNAVAWDTLGAVLLAINELDGASDALNKAVKLDPNLASAEANLGVLAAARHQWSTALRHAEQALAIEPSSAESNNNRGNALMSLGRLDEAECAFNAALSINSNCFDAMFNRSLLWLKQGRWPKAWQGFEARWQSRQMAPFKREFNKPLWDGSDSMDKVLLIHAEQGLGDMLMMARYFPLAEAKVGGLIVECQTELVKILTTMSLGFDVIGSGNPLPKFDMHLPAMSLPRVFHTDVNSVPWRGPYLNATHAATQIIPSEGLNIGLVWAGNSRNPSDFRRSIALHDLAPLLEINGVNFFSLQHGPEGDQLAANGLLRKITDLRPHMVDFAATGRLILELDLVISVCTSVAHLAGGMGTPLWVLLSADPDWRWLRNCGTSPWYPNARLFRQKIVGSWKTVVEETKLALSEMVESENYSRRRKTMANDGSEELGSFTRS